MAALGDIGRVRGWEAGSGAVAEANPLSDYVHGVFGPRAPREIVESVLSELASPSAVEATGTDLVDRVRTVTLRQAVRRATTSPAALVGFGRTRTGCGSVPDLLSARAAGCLSLEASRKLYRHLEHCRKCADLTSRLDAAEWRLWRVCGPGEGGPDGARGGGPIPDTGATPPRASISTPAVGSETEGPAIIAAPARPRDPQGAAAKVCRPGWPARLTRAGRVSLGLAALLLAGACAAVALPSGGDHGVTRGARARASGSIAGAGAGLLVPHLARLPADVPRRKATRPPVAPTPSPAAAATVPSPRPWIPPPAGSLRRGTSPTAVRKAAPAARHAHIHVHGVTGGVLAATEPASATSTSPSFAGGPTPHTVVHPSVATVSATSGGTSPGDL